MTEWSHNILVSAVAQTGAVAVCADADQRAAVARRLGLVALDAFALEAQLAERAGGLSLSGSITAVLTQRCVATGLPMPATITDHFSLAFVRNLDVAQPDDGTELEIELGDADCDLLPLEDERVDVAEAAIQSLALALDPYPRHPDADRILREKGVLNENEAGPFAALAALRKQ